MCRCLEGDTDALASNAVAWPLAGPTMTTRVCCVTCTEPGVFPVLIRGPIVGMNTGVGEDTDEAGQLGTEGGVSVSFLSVVPFAGQQYPFSLSLTGT